MPGADLTNEKSTLVQVIPKGVGKSIHLWRIGL